MTPDENDVMENEQLEELMEKKSYKEAYMDWLIIEEGYPRRKARRKAERKYGKGGTENDR